MENLKKIVYSPWFVGVTSICTIIGLLLSIYFYLQTVQERELTYYISPVRTTIYKTGQSSKLSIKIDNNDRNENISSLQVAIWNKGKLSIRNSNLLDSIFIKMDPKVEIVDVLVKKMTRKLINFRFSNEYLKEGKIPITWDILEQGDGVVLQIVYLGNENTGLYINGNIEKPSMVIKKDADKLKSLDEQYSEVSNTAYLYLSISIGLLSVLIGSIILDQREKGKNKNKLIRIEEQYQNNINKINEMYSKLEKSEENLNKLERDLKLEKDSYETMSNLYSDAPFNNTSYFFYGAMLIILAVTFYLFIITRYYGVPQFFN